MLHEMSLFSEENKESICRKCQLSEKIMNSFCIKCQMLLSEKIRSYLHEMSNPTFWDNQEYVCKKCQTISGGQLGVNLHKMSNLFLGKN